MVSEPLPDLFSFAFVPHLLPLSVIRQSSTHRWHSLPSPQSHAAQSPSQRKNSPESQSPGARTTRKRHKDRGKGQGGGRRVPQGHSRPLSSDHAIGWCTLSLMSRLSIETSQTYQGETMVVVRRPVVYQGQCRREATGKGPRGRVVSSPLSPV
jgi:hypothetical protein